MEAKDFENSIKERFADHGAATPESVWNAITDDLDRKRRILAFWWWNALSALCILILATSFYWNMDQTPIGNNTEVPFSSATAVPSNERIEDDEILGPDAPKELVQSRAGNHATDRNEVAQSNPVKKNKNPNETNNKRTNTPRLDGSEQPLIDVRSTAVISTKLPTELPDSAVLMDEHLSLEPLVYDRLPMKNGALMEVVTYQKTTPNFYHSFGLELSTFANLSKPRVVQSSSTNSFTESTTSDQFRYHKYLEIAPYYQFSFNGWKSNLKVVSLVSFANSIGSLKGKHTSYGAGLGYSHHFSMNRRTLFGIYGTSSWEMNLSRLANNPTSAITDSTSIPNGFNQESVTSKYRQNLLSVEAGIEIHYMLTLKTHLYTSLGYRNYFWQQKVTASPTVQIPQLMKFSIGVSHTL